MQSPKIGMIKLHLFLQKRVFTARATIMYLSIYMYMCVFYHFSSFANKSTDITHLNQNARPGVTAYVGIDNKRMKYVNGKHFFQENSIYKLYVCNIIDHGTRTFRKYIVCVKRTCPDIVFLQGNV